MEKITVTNSPAGDSLRTAQAEQALERHLGSSLFQATKGTETFYTVENDLMKIRFSNKGGRVASVELKDYKTYGGQPLVLFADTTSVFDLSFFIKQGYNDAQIRTGDYYFTPAEATDLTFGAGQEQKGIRPAVAGGFGRLCGLRLHDPQGQLHDRLRRAFRRYAANLVAEPGRHGNHVAECRPQNEKGFENENRYTTIAYNYPGDDGIEELGISNETKEETINSKIKWVAFKQQFFSSILIAGDDFQNGSVKFTTFAPTAREIKTFHTQLAVPYTPQTDHYDFSFYFGPNKYSTLKKYDDLHLQKLVPLGGWIIGWVNRWLVIPTFDFLGKYISNYGLIILLLTIFIKNHHLAVDLQVLPFDRQNAPAETGNGQASTRSTRNRKTR